MFLFILGVIPYILMGILLATMGYSGLGSWQAWAVMGIMLVSDLISYAQGVAKAFNSR
jgi:hypothetical protein